MNVDHGSQTLSQVEESLLPSKTPSRDSRAQAKGTGYRAHTHSLEAGLIVCPVHPCPGTMLVSKANPGVHRVHVLLKKLLWGDEGDDFK